MQAAATPCEWMDVRRVVDRAVCDWVLAGRPQTVQVVLPSGALRSAVNFPRVRWLLFKLMDRAVRNAGRFDRMLLLVERIDERIVLKVGTQSRPPRAIRLPLVLVQPVVRATDEQVLFQMRSTYRGAHA